MAELLIRWAETKNSNSAQIWLSKAEALNRGSVELFELKMDYMKWKGVKPVEIVNFVQAQIKLNTRQLSLYVALIEQIIAGGLPRWTRWFGRWRCRPIINVINLFKYN